MNYDSDILVWVCRTCADGKEHYIPRGMMHGTIPMCCVNCYRSDWEFVREE